MTERGEGLEGRRTPSQLQGERRGGRAGGTLSVCSVMRYREGEGKEERKEEKDNFHKKRKLKPAASPSSLKCPVPGGARRYRCCGSFISWEWFSWARDIPALPGPVEAGLPLAPRIAMKRGEGGGAGMRWSLGGFGGEGTRKGEDGRSKRP